MPRFKVPNGVKIFAVTWLLILLLPPTREFFKSFFSLQSFSSPAFSIKVPTQEQTAQRLHQEFLIPGGMWLGEQEYIMGERTTAINRLDALRERFPQHLEISALEVQLLSNGPAHWDKAKFDSTLMKKAAQVAFQAGQREPQNVFWAMMESGFYLRAKQKEAALQAIKRAKAGTKYDDYSQQIIRERIHFSEQQESIVWERKVALWASVLYPQLGHFRETLKPMTQEAVAAKKRGDNTQAIEIMGALLNVSQLVRRDGQVIIANMIGESVGRESLNEFFGMKAWRNSASIEEKTSFHKTLFRKWANFSRTNGKPELIKYANFLNEPSITTQTRGFWGNDIYAWLGLPTPYGFITLTGTALLVWIAVLSLGCGFIWLLHAFIFARNNHNDEMPLSRGAVTSCVSFSFWATVGLVAIAIKMQWLNLTSNFVGTETSYVFPLLMPLFMMGIWLLPVYFQLQKRKFRLVQVVAAPKSETKREVTRLSPQNNRLRRFAWIIGFSMIGLLIYSFNGLDSVAVPALSTPIAILSFIAAIRLEIINQRSKHRVLRRFRLERVDFPKPSVSLKSRLVRLGLWAGFVLSVIVIQSNWPSTLPDLVLVAVFGIACLGGAMWVETRNDNTSFAFARRLASQSAGVLGIVWSLFFVIGSLGLWPLRAQLNSQFERRLQMSEFDWMKEIVEKNRQNSPEENSGG